MKKILFLLLLPLIMISCSIHPKNVVGEVAGHPIPSKYYFNSLREKMAEFALSNGRKPNQIERKKIEDQTWRQIVEKIVYEKMYAENKLSVTNDEIENYLIENIPAFLKNNPKLKSHNKFSESLYLSSVKTDSPLDLSRLRKDVFYVIINQKLKEKIVRNYVPSDADLKREIDKYYIKGDVNIYQLFPNSNYGNVADNEIKRYYADHINDFRTKAFVKLQYVKFPITLGKVDFNQTKHIADSLFTEFKKGVSFSLVVNQKSDLYFGEEMPFTYVDSLNSVVKNQLSKLSEKQFCKPFLYKNSYYILELERRTKNMVKYMALEIPVKPTDSTLNKVKDKVIDFKELSDEIGFEKAAVETDHKLIETDKIYPDNPVIPGLGRSDGIIIRALKRNDKFIPKFHPYLNEYILFYVKSKQIGGFKKIAEVKSNIIKKIKLEKLMTKLGKTDLNKIFSNGRGKILRFSDVGYDNFEKKCIGFEAFKKPLFDCPKENKFTKPICIENSVSAAKWTKIGKRLPGMIPEKYRESALRILREKYFKKYISDSFKKADVKDWRND